MQNAAIRLVLLAVMAWVLVAPLTPKVFYPGAVPASG